MYKYLCYNSKQSMRREIKIIEEKIKTKYREQSIILLKQVALFLAIMVLALIITPPVVNGIIACTTLITLMTIYLLTMIPKTNRMLCNFILKLSPKLRASVDEENRLKKELSRKKEIKKELEEKNIELFNKLNKAEVDMKNKESELRKREGIYFNNIFNKENLHTTKTKPIKKTIKIRIKKKIK